MYVYVSLYIIITILKGSGRLPLKTDFYFASSQPYAIQKPTNSKNLLTNAICLDVSLLFALENKNQRWETVRGHQKPIEAKR